MTSITLQFPSDLTAGLKKLCARQNRSIDDVLVESLRRYLIAEQYKKFAQSKHSKRPAMQSRKIASGRHPPSSIPKIKQNLLDGMVSYMKSTEQPGFGYTCGYRLADIRRVAAIVDAFLDKISTVPKRDGDRILDVVKRAVLKLNVLNEKCGRGLIETDQREDICKLIQLAAKKAGLKQDGDFTEPWREW